MLLKVIGEWLNGRVMVSKTTGCVFESRLPCHLICSLLSQAAFYFALSVTNTQQQPCGLFA